MGLRIGLPLFAAALAADLASKAIAVGAGAHVYYHAVDAHLLRRAFMSVFAIGFAAACSLVAARRGLGRPWGAWVGAPLLVAGVLANGLSVLIWPAGVPDFIPTGEWVGNLADFEIFFGIVGGFLALIVGAFLSYGRGLLDGPARSEI